MEELCQGREKWPTLSHATDRSKKYEDSKKPLVEFTCDLDKTRYGEVVETKGWMNEVQNRMRG